MAVSGRAYIIIAAFILDCILGDPQNKFHPMRIIGSGITAGVAAYGIARPKSPITQFIMGMVLAVAIVTSSFAVTWLITHSLFRLNYWVGLIAEAILCYFIIAPKALKESSMMVYHSLIERDILNARRNLSFIVGRDTRELSAEGIVKAAVETVAENLSDGVIAPLMFVCVGGAPLGMAYKAVNTLDSMIGYRNEDFEYFGKFAARLDDVINFIPARVSALLMIFGSVFVGGDVKGALSIFIRDRYKHKSPNSAQTEAVCAGALGICLGGDSYYNGMLVSKPVIGDGVYEPEPMHIVAANRLMYAASLLAVLLFACLSALR